MRSNLPAIQFRSARIMGNYGEQLFKKVSLEFLQQAEAAFVFLCVTTTEKEP